MFGLRDLVAGSGLDRRTSPLPAVMRARIHSIDSGQIRVTIPTVDGERGAHEAFGHYPDAGVGDEVRVVIDEFNTPVIVAWEPNA